MMDLVARVIAEQVQLRVAQQSQAQSQQSQQSQQSRVFGGEAEVGDSQSVSGQQGAHFMFGMQGSQSVSGMQGSQYMLGMQENQSVLSQQGVSGGGGLQLGGVGSLGQSAPSQLSAPTEDHIFGMLAEFISTSMAKEQLFEIFTSRTAEYLSLGSPSPCLGSLS